MELSHKLESLIAAGAHIKTFTKKDMSRVSIKLVDGTEHHATAHTLEIALDRVLAKIDSRSKDHKLERRRKERERQEILNAIEEYSEDEMYKWDEYH